MRFIGDRPFCRVREWVAQELPLISHQCLGAGDAGPRTGSFPESSAGQGGARRAPTSTFWFRQWIMKVHTHGHPGDWVASLNGAMAKIIPFPADKVRRHHPVAAVQPEVRSRPLLQGLGRMLRRERRPHALQEIQIDESPTGQRLSVWVGEFYVRICVDGQDYYFDRATGQFDGRGAAP